MKELYILSLGAGLNQIELIQNIKKMGYKAISCDLNPDASGKEISDIFINISSHNYVEIIEEIKKLDIKLVAVLTRSTGNPVLSVSKIAEEFGLKALSSDIAKVLTDKYKFIHKLNELEIPAPRIYSLTEKNEISYPVFVKPSKTNRSHAGMSKCLNLSELEKSYEVAVQITENNEVNIEEYLLGYDFVCFDYIYEREIIHLATVGEVSSGEPKFDGIGFYSCPPDIETFISKTINKFIEKFKVDIGFIQTAAKVNFESETSKIYESHAEIGGDLVNDTFIPYISDGYNVFEQAITLFLGNKPAKIEANIKPAVILFKDKIKQYEITYEHPLVVDYVHGKDYIIVSFKDFNAMSNYLKQIKHASITNQKGVINELG